MAEQAGIPFHAISTGKWRRYFSFQNIIDLFRVPLGALQARRLLKKLKPDWVVATGGFVSVPVLWAAIGLQIPTILYEPDALPSLTTRFFESRVTHVIRGFDVGHIVRPQIFTGDPQKGLSITGFSGQRPILLVMGGSQGAQELNTALEAERSELEKTHDIIHLFGAGKGRATQEPHYWAKDSVSDEMPHLYAISDLVLTRGGANSLAELFALNLRSLVWPLGLQASHGDQIVNTETMLRRGAPFMQHTPGRKLHEELNELQQMNFKNALPGHGALDAILQLIVA